MFWMRYKENNFPLRTLIWRPGFCLSNKIMLNLVDFPLFTVNTIDESMSHVTENGLDKGREEKSLPLQDDSLEIRPNSPEEMTSHEPMQQHSVIDEVGLTLSSVRS